MRSSSNSGEGAFNILKVIALILGAYTVVSCAIYVWVRIAADANSDGKVTELEYTTKKAALITGAVSNVFGPGLTFVEGIIVRFWAYDVVVPAGA